MEESGEETVACLSTNQRSMLLSRMVARWRDCSPNIERRARATLNAQPRFMLLGFTLTAFRSSRRSSLQPGLHCIQMDQLRSWHRAML